MPDSIGYNCACSDEYPTKTLEEMRNYLMARLGFATQIANPPPGMTTLLNSFLQEAQELAYRDYSVFRLERYFTWQMEPGVKFYDLDANEGLSALTTPVNAAFSTSTSGGELAAGTYWYRVSAINVNGETLASTQTSQVTTGSSSTVTINWAAVSGATGYRIYGRTTGAQQYLATVGGVTTYADDGSITPDGALPTVNTTACSKLLDPRKITWVGISNDDNWWYPLVCGIRPELYSFQASGWPTHYEIRQCIEVWPPPESTEWKLRVKGYFGLLDFDADSDVNTIDYTAIQLLALANAKAHFGQPDAANYVQQYRGYISNLTAGSHMTKRYIPGDAGWVPSPNPVWIPLS